MPYVTPQEPPRRFARPHQRQCGGGRGSRRRVLLSADIVDSNKLAVFAKLVEFHQRLGGDLGGKSSSGMIFIHNNFIILQQYRVLFLKMSKVHTEVGPEKPIYHSEITLCPLQLSFAGKQCRICLSEWSYTNKLISPCECNGTVQYVHQDCLREWLLKKIGKTSLSSMPTKISCQLCKQPIKAAMQECYNCLSCESICKKIRERPYLFTICLIGGLISLTLILFSLTQLIMGVSGSEQNRSTQQIVFVLAVILNILLLIFFVYNLISYLYEIKVKISFTS